MKIDERKLKILQFVIQEFINNARPIGSKTLVTNYPLNVSSATIRNDMAALEKMGYLVQPYTSAGRVPSELGYRLYVDNLMKLEGLGYEQKDLIKKLLLNNVIEVEDVIHQSLEILTDLSDMTAIASLPQFNKSKLTNLKLINVNGSKVLLVFVSDTGIVKNIQLPIEGISQKILDLISEVMLNKLEGSTISDITVKKISRINSELPHFKEVINYIVPVLRENLKSMDKVEVKLEGINKIFDLPEFQDVRKVKNFLSVIEDENTLKKVLNCDEIGKNISVKIGDEVGLEELEHCTVITAGYTINGKESGRIGVIGPTRINYPKVISIVNYIRDTLSEIFSGISL